MPVGAGNDTESGPAMTLFVTPDVIGRLLLTGGGLPGGAGNDTKSEPEVSEEIGFPKQRIFNNFS